MYRLGSQGRAAQQSLAKQQHFSSGESTSTALLSHSQAQNDVNLLLSILRSTNSSNLTASNLLSYVVNYFPKVKNAENLKLLSKALFKNTVVFNNIVNVNDGYLIIEAIKATFDTKIKISEPSLQLPEFFNSVITPLYESRIEPWKKMLVATGVLLSEPLYQTHAIPETRAYFDKTYASLVNLNHHLLVQLFGNVQVNGFEINTLSSIALACSLPFFNSHQKSHLPHDSIFLFTNDLIFQSPLGLRNGSTEELSKSQSPALKHLSRLSFLIENCLLHGVSYPILHASFSDILQFSIGLINRVVNTPKSWDFLKNILFSIIIIFQGFCSFSLNLFNGLKPDQFSQLSETIMKVLFHLNFIIEKIGTGGFQAYNFVYLTNVDGLLQTSLSKAQELASFFIRATNLNKVPRDHYESSKVLFALTYFESLIKSCSEEYYNKFIEPYVSILINHTHPNQSPEFIQMQRSIIEASHSVILSTFRNPKNSLVITTTAISYLHTVLSQFPTFLSTHQLKLAIETIARSVSPPSDAFYLNKDNFRELIHSLYMAILNTDPRQPLPTDNGENNGPLTVRVALIDCLISILPYVHASKFNDWLNNISGLIEATPIGQEHQFLQDSLWKMLSEGLDIQRGNIGIRWWYSRADLASKL